MQNKLYLSAALSLVLITACHDHAGHHHDENEHEAAEAAQSAHAHSGEIVMSPDKAKAAGVVVSAVEQGDFYGVISVGGKIMEASGDEATMVANTSGTVSFLQGMTEGMAVAKGKPLFSISGEHLQDGDPMQRARINYETAKKEYERAQKLIEDKIISEKDFNAVEAAYENARVAYEAVGRNSNGGTTVTAPIAGYIKSCLVTEGDYVSVGQPLASITQNRRLYLKANVPERYFAEIAGITSAKFKTSYSDSIYDIRTLGGRLLAYGKAADNAAYIPVTFEFNNSHGILPGAFAEIYLLTHKRENVISLPVSAITEEQGLHFVYIQLDEDCYKKREVKLGQSSGDLVEIAAGLKAGEQVVTQGAIHVKLASANNIIPAHTHSH